MTSVLERTDTLTTRLDLIHRLLANSSCQSPLKKRFLAPPCIIACWLVGTQQQQRMQVLATSLRANEHIVANGAVIFLTLEMLFFFNWKYVAQ